MSTSSFPAQTIVVTNRMLCIRPFLEQVERVCSLHPSALILREKDLDVGAYRDLAESVLGICRSSRVPCLFHTHADIACDLQADGIHLPLGIARELDPATLANLPRVGISVHSPDEAQEAQDLGAHYLIAGHIYETACKPGLAPRGLEMLRDVCASTSLPVYAIGGIDLDLQRRAAAMAVGAQGTCTMSAAMTL